MNPIIIGSCAIAGVILGKVFSKNKTDTGDNINIKGNSNSNSNSNSNKHLTRKEILTAVNERVDKLERIKKKKARKNVVKPVIKDSAISEYIPPDEVIPVVEIKPAAEKINEKELDKEKEKP